MDQPLFQRLHSRLAATGKIGAFPWAAVIQAILTALGGCTLKPATAADIRALELTADAEAWFNICCSRELRNAGVRPNRLTLTQVKLAVLKARDDTPPEDLEALLASSFDWGV